MCTLSVVITKSLDVILVALTAKGDDGVAVIVPYTILTSCSSSRVIEKMIALEMLLRSSFSVFSKCQYLRDQQSYRHGYEIRAKVFSYGPDFRTLGGRSAGYASGL